MKKNRLLIILLILPIFLIISYFHTSITGMVADAIISLSVEQSTQACAFLSLSETYVNLTDDENFTAISENCGNQDYTGWTEIEVNDSANNTVFWTNSSGTYALGPQEYNMLTASWTPPSIGNYLATATFYYNGKTVRRTKSFEVVRINVTVYNATQRTIQKNSADYLVEVAIEAGSPKTLSLISNATGNWTAVFSDSSVTLDPMESTNLTFSLVPSSAVAVGSYTTNVSACIQDYPTLCGSATVSTTVLKNFTYEMLVDTIAGQKETIEFEEASVVLGFITDKNIKDGSLNVTLRPDTPVAANLSVYELGKYLTIEAGSDLDSSTTFVTSDIYYTDAELIANSINESTLAMYWYDAALDGWAELSPSMDWVYDTGVDASKNDVWAYTSHFSYYAVGGLVPSAVKINVTVNDTAGNLVQAATVFVWKDLYLKDSGTTDANGNWLSKWLRAGTYLVEVSKAGYSTKSKYATPSGNLNITDVFITLEPIAAPVLDVTPSAISESAYVDDIISTILTISNTGTMALLNITLSSDVDWITFNATNISRIGAGEHQNVYAYLGPIASEGIYSGNIFVVSQNDGFKSIPVTFNVRARPPPPPAAGPFIPAPAAIAPFIPPPPVYVKGMVIVDWPTEVDAVRGETKLIGITVKNTGNATLDNVTLEIEGLPFPTKVSPKSAKLLTNSTKTFIVRIEVPEDAKFTEYNFLVNAAGNGVSDSKIIKLTVVPGVPEERIKGAIEELLALVDKVWKETLEAGVRGYNVTEVFEILKDVKKNAGIAKDYLKKDDYANAGKYLEKARSDLEKAVTKLAEITAITIKVFPLEYQVAVVAVIASLVVAIIVLWKKFKEKLGRILRWQKVRELIR